MAAPAQPATGRHAAVQPEVHIRGESLSDVILCGDVGVNKLEFGDYGCLKQTSDCSVVNQKGVTSMRNFVKIEFCKLKSSLMLTPQ